MGSTGFSEETVFVGPKPARLTRLPPNGVSPEVDLHPWKHDGQDLGRGSRGPQFNAPKVSPVVGRVRGPSVFLLNDKKRVKRPANAVHGAERRVGSKD